MKLKREREKDKNIMLQMTQLCLEIIEMQDFLTGSHRYEMIHHSYCTKRAIKPIWNGLVQHAISSKP
jgi:hypothetical protein